MQRAGLAAARDAFRVQAEAVAEVSPLLGRWCERVAAGTALSDTMLAAVLDSGHRLDGWASTQQVLVAVIAELRRAPQDQLARYVPVLGGAATVDAGLDAALTAFADAHRDGVLSHLPRMMMANDPAHGLAMMATLRDLVDHDQPVDLLVIGAGAGLELVADELDPRVAVATSSRRGVDLAPVDLGDEAARRWLLSICPPEDVARHERTQQAIELRLHSRWEVEQGDVVAAVRLAGPGPLAVLGSWVLCMLEQPGEVREAALARPGVTYLVSSEHVGVHRRAGAGDGLQTMDAGDRVVRGTKIGNGRVLREVVRAL